MLISEGGRIAWSDGVNRRIDFAGEIAIGWGRHYDGKYAATAIQVVEELRRIGVLLRKPAVSEMWTLAELVHRLRDGHGPDEREYRAGALQTVVQHLVDEGLLHDSGALELLAVEDVWDYYPVSERRFGWKVQVGFGGVDIYYNNQYDLSDYSWTAYTWDYSESSGAADSQAFVYYRKRESGGDKYWSPSDNYVFRAGWWQPLSNRWQVNLNTLRNSTAITIWRSAHTPSPVITDLLKLSSNLPTSMMREPRYALVPSFSMRSIVLFT